MGVVVLGVEHAGQVAALGSGVGVAQAASKAQSRRAINSERGERASWYLGMGY